MQHQRRGSAPRLLGDLWLRSPPCLPPAAGAGSWGAAGLPQPTPRGSSRASPAGSSPQPLLAGGTRRSLQRGLAAAQKLGQCLVPLCPAASPTPSLQLPASPAAPRQHPELCPQSQAPGQPPSPDVTPAGRGQRALGAAGMGEGAVAPLRHPTGQGDASSSCSDHLTSALRSQTFLLRCSCFPRIFSRLQVWLLQATGLAAGWEPGASPRPLRLQVPSPAAWVQLGPLPAILAAMGEKIWASAWARCPPADPAPQTGVGGVSAWLC